MKKQIHLFVAEKVDTKLTNIARELGATKSELLRQAICDLIIKYEKVLGGDEVGKRKSSTNKTEK
ncbi:MAG: ribbon-helix-helix domain-containing protein [Candidatus Heimdallarchaeaceae archaeon]